MRRLGNLFDAVVEHESLRLAFCRAARGKRQRREVAVFAESLDRRLADMAAGLRVGTFPLGRFTQFEIHDPKRRVITAPAFSERVLHHAVMVVCETHFERWLVADTFACRPGKGREAAVVRAAGFARCFPWRVHLDVRQCFDSIPHDLLMGRLERHFKDRRLLGLFRGIIAGFRANLGRGLPIGSLMSQHFTNFYLGALDRFVKEELRFKGYVRYMDDLVLWGPTQAAVTGAADACRGFVSRSLGMEFKPAAAGRSDRGLDFLGCRVFPTHSILSRRSRRRYGRRLRLLARAYRLGLLDERQLQARLEATTAFARAAGVKSWRFRTAVLQSVMVGDP
jgi:RNA-directed DNA polymerase